MNALEASTLRDARSSPYFGHVSCSLRSLLNVSTNYASPILMISTVMGMVDFGNSRELSIRWMFYLAEETGPLRWVQALGKNMHHAGTSLALVYLLNFGVDSSLRPLVDQALLADYIVASSHLCIMLRFGSLGRFLQYVPPLLGGAVVVGFVVSTFMEPQSALVLCFRSLVAFAFTGTIIYNVLAAVGGGYVKSRRKAEVTVRGVTKQRSLGGMAFEQLIFSIHTDDTTSCSTDASTRCSPCTTTEESRASSPVSSLQSECPPRSVSIEHAPSVEVV